MKKLIYSLALLVTMSSLGYAQEAENIVNSKGKAALISSKISGEYDFTFATERTDESVEKAASYYVKNFTVDFDASTNKAVVTMIENTVTSRTVLARFLSSNQVRYVEIDGTNVSISDFIQSYLK
jgi:predicted solute-binding protein